MQVARSVDLHGECQGRKEGEEPQPLAFNMSETFRLHTLDLSVQGE